MNNTDLHIHSYYSDGSFSPKEIINIAIKKKLKAISITDHNSLFGSQEAYNYKKNIEIIPGIEINSKITEILGYFIDFEDNNLNTIIEDIRESKTSSTYDKIDQLKDINVDIEVEEVLEKVHEKSYPMLSHVAMVLEEKKICGFQEFFEKILPKTERAYQKQYTNKKIIKTITNAGGVAVLPHPWFLSERIFEEFDCFLRKIVSYGVCGIETIGAVPDKLKHRMPIIIEKCKEYNLVPCGGSDFHSDKYLKQNILGKYNIPYNTITKLKNHL